MKKKQLRSIELFAGIGGFKIACDSLDINTIWANDIDLRASVVYRKNFPEVNHVHGDINKLINDIPEHDLLTGGFPCQPFSSAGKKLGIYDHRGTLFSTIIKIIEQKKPDYFVLENVKRILSMDNGKHFAIILNELSQLGYFIEWRVLNAIHFGLPQHRERIIITGYKQNVSDIAPRLLPLTDLNSLGYKNLQKIYDFKLWQTISNHNKKFKNWGCAYQGVFVDADPKLFSESTQLTHLREVLEKNPDPFFDFTDDTLNRIQNSIKVNRYYNGVEILYNQRGGARMGYSIFGVNGVAPTLTCSTSRHYERYEIGDKYRRLTNIEYARIQGFPDNHCEEIPVYDQYALYGNAVPPLLVKWAIKKVIYTKGIVSTELKESNESLYSADSGSSKINHPEQLSLYPN